VDDARVCFRTDPNVKLAKNDTDWVDIDDCELCPYSPDNEAHNEMNSEFYEPWLGLTHGEVKNLMFDLLDETRDDLNYYKRLYSLMERSNENKKIRAYDAERYRSLRLLLNQGVKLYNDAISKRRYSMNDYLNLQHHMEITIPSMLGLIRWNKRTQKFEIQYPLSSKEDRWFMFLHGINGTFGSIPPAIDLERKRYKNLRDEFEV
jgi:hypothetical protein